MRRFQWITKFINSILVGADQELLYTHQIEVCSTSFTYEPNGSKNLEKLDFCSMTPLLIASYHGFWKVLEVFVDYNEQSSLLENKNQNNPYDIVTKQTLENVFHLIFNGLSTADVKVDIAVKLHFSIINNQIIFTDYYCLINDNQINSSFLFSGYDYKWI